MHREELRFETPGRGTQEITREVQRVIARSGIDAGMANVFVHHTSCSLLLNENADPEVRRDFERFLSRLVPDGDPLFRHTDEGPDDMPAHVRAALTATTLTLPVVGNRGALGTWQGIYLFEHRTAPHRRRITVSVWG
ncbi:MAG: secondary thiamine-phosphate synthase [Sandaracinus sp.]|nr:secondary thiamine-phosphate synthase [Sandaracinus sp.]|tara:strand:- start:5993 stop:6403 length:411 start_codon:yes stop_codon:yes gene_type:complete